MNSPVDYEINKELGECYLFMGEYEKACEYYEKATACNETAAEPLLGLAAVALGKGDMDEAYSLYCRAEALHRSDLSLTGMAMLECEFGRHEEAFTNFSQALELNPGNMMAVNGMLQLSHLDFPEQHS